MVGTYGELGAAGACDEWRLATWQSAARAADPGGRMQTTLVSYVLLTVRRLRPTESRVALDTAVSTMASRVEGRPLSRAKLSAMAMQASRVAAASAAAAVVDVGRASAAVLIVVVGRGEGMRVWDGGRSGAGSHVRGSVSFSAYAAEPTSKGAHEHVPCITD